MPANGKAIKLSDIARECGVSATTAGKVLNRSAGSNVRVSEQTAKRIIEVAKRLNYQPNLSACILRGCSSRLVGVLIDSFMLESLARMLTEIEYQASRFDYQLMISSAHDSISRFKSAFLKLQQYGAESIICISHDYPCGGDELYDFLQKESRRVVLVGKPRHGKFWYVSPDYSTIVKTPFDFFVAQGRRKIVHICFSGEDLCLAENRRVFQELSATAGIERKMLILEPSVDRWQITRQLNERMFDEAIRWGCDAVIAQNDHIAAVAIHNLQQHGCRVPEDVAVIGRGNDSFDDIVTPAISTMDDGLARQGKAAFDLVRLQLENLRNGHDGEQTLLVPPEFIRRSSSG